MTDNSANAPEEDEVSDAEWDAFLGNPPDNANLPSELNRKGDVRGFAGNSSRNWFRKGQSGNPKGRPKGIPNFRTSAKNMLGKPVSINSGGRNRKISTQDAVLMRLREKGLSGDFRSLVQMLVLGQKHNNDEESTSDQDKLSAEDQQFLEETMARLGLTPRTGDAASENSTEPDEEGDE